MEGEGEGRDLALCQNNATPFAVERHLDFIDISEGGSLLLGSSNLTGKYWNGCIFYYNNPDHAPDNNKWLAGHNCESGVTCGKFLHSEDKVIVGEDSGSLTVFSIVSVESGELHFVPVIIAANHDGAITSIDVTKPKDYVISGGDDLCINVWERESMCSAHRWYPAHARAVTGVSASPSSPDVFASSSLDATALLWDTRMPKPAIMLESGGGFGLTCVAWASDTVALVGDRRGALKALDTRRPGALHQARLLDRSVHTLAPTSDPDSTQASMVAVCGDTPTLVIWDPVKNDVLYKDDKSHTGMVRGLAWTPDSSKLYSCGLDKRVISHSPFVCSGDN